MAVQSPVDSVAFLGRQPIVRADLDVYGYELLFRMGADNSAGVSDGDASTAEVVLNTFVEFGLENVLGRKRGFVNATRDFLLGSFASQLPPDRVVIEILENVEADVDTVAAVRALCEAKYELALDDYRPGTSADEFFPYVRIVKIDLRDYTPDSLAAEAARLKRFGFRLLIERVETEAEFESCRSLGFELFQGFYVARPTVVTGSRQKPQRLATLHLLTRLSDDASTVTELEEAISADPVLTHKLLRVVNSAAFAVHREIDSLRQAVLFLGRARIHKWVTLLVLVGLSARLETTLNVLLRARVCEQLGQRLMPERAQTFFMMGLLSTLDRLLGIPMEQVLESLPLGDDLNQALLTRAGLSGQVLAAVEAYEACDWEHVVCEGLTDQDFQQVWSESLRWMRRAEKDLAMVG